MSVALTWMQHAVAAVDAMAVFLGLALRCYAANAAVHVSVSTAFAFPLLVFIARFHGCGVIDQ